MKLTRVLTALWMALSGGCVATTSTTARRAPPPALEVALQYDPEMSPIVAPEVGRGRLMGSGVGQVHGAVEGDVRWTLFEVQSPTSCELQLVGVITSSDGEEVRFEAIGYGSRPRSGSPRWDMTASVAFLAGPESQSPLAGRVAAWVGFFDARTGRHQYQVHLPVRGGAGS